MKIAELYALVGLRPDKRSIGKVDKMLASVGAKMKSIATSGFFQVAGAAALGLATKDALKFSNSIDELDIASNGAIGTVDSFTKKVLALSDATGQNKENVQAAAAEYVALTGDGAGATKQLDVFARAATATGGTMSDIARAGAALNTSMGITGDTSEKAFSILIDGGKKGAVELKDLAGVASSVAPQFADFARGKGVEGVAKLGAALQLARRGFGSARETRTGVKALLSSLSGRAEEIKKIAHVRVFKKGSKTEKRELFQILADLKAQEGRIGSTALQKLIGSSTAFDAFKQITKTKGEVQALTKSTLKSQAVAEDFAKKMKRNAQRVAVAWNKVKNTATRAFLVVVKGLGWVIKHSKLTVLAIASIAGALVILRAQAIATAIATRIGMILALAPFLLLAATVGGVILLIQDLWSWMNGGKSVLGNLWQDFHDFGLLVGALLVELGAEFKRVFLAVFDWFAARIKWAVDKLRWLSNQAAKLTGSATGVVKLALQQKIDRQNAARRNVDTKRGAGFEIGTINVNGTGDPAETAKHVRTELDSWWSGELRGAQAAK